MRIGLWVCNLLNNLVELFITTKLNAVDLIKRRSANTFGSFLNPSVVSDQTPITYEKKFTRYSYTLQSAISSPT